MIHSDDRVESTTLPLRGTFYRHMLILGALQLLLTGCADLLPQQPKNDGGAEVQDEKLRKAEEEYAAARAKRFFEEEGSAIVMEMQKGSPAFFPGERNPFADAAVMEALAEEDRAARRLFEAKPGPCHFLWQSR